MKFRHTLILSALLPLTACASAAAAKKTGVSIKSVEKCRTLICLQTQKSAEKVDEKQLESGLTQYVFRMQKKQGSYLRSIGYGVAAVGTLGLSEVIATPAEGALQNKKQFAAVADCDDNGTCSRLVLVEQEKEPYIVMGHTQEELTAIEAAKAAAADESAK
ncbi:MAG: hypothetical protein ABJG88_03995 [Litorimonas sp.]